MKFCETVSLPIKEKKIPKYLKNSLKLIEKLFQNFFEPSKMTFRFRAITPNGFPIIFSKKFLSFYKISHSFCKNVQFLNFCI